MRDDGALVIVDVEVNVEKSIAELPTELQPTCRKLQAMFGQYRTKNLENYYRVGEVVREGLERLAKKQDGQEGTSYGTAAVAQWEEALGIPARTLYTAMALVRTYTSDELKKLVKTDCFTTSHFAQLLSVGDPLQRQQWEQRVIAERWSAARLAEEIRGVLGNRRLNSGRRPQAPKSFREAFSRLMRGLRQSKTLLTGTIFGDEFDITNAICETSPSEWSVEKLGEIRKAAEMLDEVGRTAQEDAAKLRQAGNTVERILSKQKPKPAIVADEDAPPVADEELGGDDDEDAAA